MVPLKYVSYQAGFIFSLCLYLGGRSNFQGPPIPQTDLEETPESKSF
jgi:hypothetical protein